MSQMQGNIAQLQRDNEQLQQRLRLAQQMAESSIDCVVALDLDFRILSWNNTCVEHSGIEAIAVSGRPFFEAFPLRETAARLKSHLELGLKGFKSYFPPEEQPWFAGYFELYIIPLKDEDGAVSGLQIIAHEVAHRFKAEQELKALNIALQDRFNELQKVSSELAAFTHITSHELKEPLRKIYSTLERVAAKEKDTLSNDSRAALRRSQSSIQRIGLLADTLVTLSNLKVEPGAIVALNDIVDQAMSIIRPLINDTHATIRYGALPQLRGSKQQLVLLFQQLIGSVLRSAAALQLQPAIVLESAISEGDDNGAAGGGTKYHRLSISCSSLKAGWEVADQTISATTASSFTGTGFGLALARKILHNHQGYLTLQQGEARGLVIDCYFPAAE